MYIRYIVDWLTMNVQYVIRVSLKTIDNHSLIWLLFIDKQVTSVTTDNTGIGFELRLFDFVCYTHHVFNQNEYRFINS